MIRYCNNHLVWFRPLAKFGEVQMYTTLVLPLTNGEIVSERPFKKLSWKTWIKLGEGRQNLKPKIVLKTIRKVRV